MTTIIWKTCREHGTSKSRYKARRAQIMTARQADARLARQITKALVGGNMRGHKTGDSD